MNRAAIFCAAAGAGILLAAGASLASGAFMLVRLAVLGGALGALVLYDLREHRIPNRVVLPAIAICVVLSLAEGIHPSAGFYLGAAFIALMFAVSLAAPAVLGMGDVKLALLILCALDGFASLALLIAFELYVLIGIALLIRRGRAALGIALPLAPMIAASCLITVLL
jgi:leader peptidase (prepilin peptidase) / N-methyltransferase